MVGIEKQRGLAVNTAGMAGWHKKNAITFLAKPPSFGMCQGGMYVLSLSCVVTKQCRRDFAVILGGASEYVKFGLVSCGGCRLVARITR